MLINNAIYYAYLWYYYYESVNYGGEPPLPANGGIMAKTILDYRAGRPIWCSYCGNYSLLTALYMALAELGVEPEGLALVSGIGCSSRMPGFVKGYGFHTVHGRALPIATGVKEANPALTVVVVSGDGDGLGIGGGHLLHAFRRNADMALMLVDNGLYGMTKGQPSPTTPYGLATSTTPYGNPDTPLNPVALALSMGASYVARGYTGEIDPLKEILAGAIGHRGFAFVHAITPCPTFNARETYKYYSKKVDRLPDTHDPSDLPSALVLAADTEMLHTGLFYKAERPTLEDALQSAREKAGHAGFTALVERFR